MNLPSCGEKLGIVVDTKLLHTSEYDVDLTVDTYERIVTRLKAAA